MLKAIYRRVKKKLSTQKCTPSIRKVSSINNVAVVVSSTSIKKGFKRTLDDVFLIISEDFNFTWLDASSKPNSHDLNNFDFLIVIDAWGGIVDTYIRSLKLNLPKGIILATSTVVPKRIEASHDYDVLWFKTFKYGENFATHPNKFHALGISNASTDLSLDISVNDAQEVLISNEEEILHARMVGSKFVIPENYQHLSELKKSPIWDDLYFGNQIRSGMNSLVEDNTRKTNLILSTAKLKAGRFSFHNGRFYATGHEFVEVGSFCSFGKNIVVYTSNHDTNYACTQGFIYRKFFESNHPGERGDTPSLARSKGPVIIKNDVWIGDDVKIMSGITIGNGACIAAGSIVTSDVADYAVVGGVPAKLLKMRFTEEVVNFMLEVQWWNWSDSKIKKNEVFFEINFNSIESVKNISIQ